MSEGAEIIETLHDDADAPSFFSRRLILCINWAFVLLLPLAMVFQLLLFRGSLRELVIINDTVTDVIAYFSGALLLASIFYFAWVIDLARRRYHEVAPCTDAELPRCAVIVPAYNEGRHVLTTLDSIFSGDYPADKLEVVAINDGSTDDTWTWIERGAARYGKRLTTINLTRNRGKRGAMYEGFLASSSEILVTIDSDSTILPDTLRRLNSPFVGDPGIGGVAGNVRVLNCDGVIPHMLDVNFVFSFDLMRSAQGALRTVFCSPGALTACRREVVLPYLEEWVNQTFLGRPANIGEDRALTNIILRSGHAVAFQQNALVLTKVPEKYGSFANMLIRWARSNVRENLDMLDFAFNFRQQTHYSRAALLFHLAMQLLWMWTPVVALFLFIYCMIATLGSFLFSLFPMLVISSLFPVLVYLRYRGGKGGAKVYLYAVLSFIAMFWVAPYSLFSVHRSGWLTR